MNFEQDKSIEKMGRVLGYIFAYFLFTIILFSMLSFLNKIPDSWSHLHIMIITLIITFIALIIKRFLG